MMTTWKEHYWYTVPIMRKRIETIVELAAPQGKEVVEVGCNEGFLSKALLEAGAKDVVAIDFDPEMVNRARELFNVNALRGDICDLNIGDQSCDIACACEVLEHITNPFKGLAELFRIAREKVIISVPVGRYWMGELQHQWELQGKFIAHDSVDVYHADKDILILCFHRKRDSQYKDIEPFNTAALKKEFNIK